MSTKAKIRKKLSENEIDRIVTDQSDEVSAWERPISVKRQRATSLSIPASLAARAAFLARIHRKGSLDDWLTRIIKERVEFEEAVFTGMKRDLTAKTG